MRPMTQVVQMTYQNPHASGPMYVPVAVICNTPDEDLTRNIRVNSARDLAWLQVGDVTDRSAIMVGGGPSLADTLDEVRELQQVGGIIFAMNAASQYLGSHGIVVDYQVIADAKPETAQLVDPAARAHLFASQANPLTFDAIKGPIVWHLEIGDVETHFPPDRVARGGYALTGGGVAVGNAALCVAYAMGHRHLHLFGYDSCHRNDESHAYPQQMNTFIPCVEVTWGGRAFKSSVSMKAQAEKFVLTAKTLKEAGCTLQLYGDGLLQSMYSTPPGALSERDKYTLMWQMDSYREHSPGELIVPVFIEAMKPDSLIVDFGCGTGRAGLALREAGHDVYLIDFADNCRDEEALTLPFLQWDLGKPCPLRVKFGLCTDVMEHIPADQVDGVVSNIMASAEAVFFQISTVNDVFGDLIGQRLHQSVHPHEWWRALFERLGYSIRACTPGEVSSIFIVDRQTSALAA